jgi:hypothetical protein
MIRRGGGLRCAWPLAGRGVVCARFGWVTRALGLLGLVCMSGALLAADVLLALPQGRLGVVHQGVLHCVQPSRTDSGWVACPQLQPLRLPDDYLRLVSNEVYVMVVRPQQIDFYDASMTLDTRHTMPLPAALQPAALLHPLRSTEAEVATYDGRVLRVWSRHDTASGGELEVLCPRWLGHRFGVVGRQALDVLAISPAGMVDVVPFHFGQLQPGCAPLSGGQLVLPAGAQDAFVFASEYLAVVQHGVVRFFRFNRKHAGMPAARVWETPARWARFDLPAPAGEVDDEPEWLAPLELERVLNKGEPARPAAPVTPASF